MTDKSEKEQTIDTYNKSARLHTDKFDEIDIRFDDIEKTFSYINKPNPKTIEFGCGNGRDAQEIVKRTNDYLGVDLSNELLKIARDKVPNANFKLDDFETLDLPRNTDIIFAFASLLHSNKKILRRFLKRRIRL